MIISPFNEFQNKIYNKFIASLCDQQAINHTLFLQKSFRKLFFLNLRVLRKEFTVGHFIFSHDFIGRPVATTFCKKSGLARLHLNKISSKFDRGWFPISHKSAITFASIPSFGFVDKKLKNNLNVVRFVWNKKWLLKRVLLWEQFFMPGAFVLNGVGNWHTFFLSENLYIVQASWVRRDLEFLLLSLFVSKALPAYFQTYVSPLVLEEIFTYFKLHGPVQFHTQLPHNFFAVFNTWALSSLEWSGLFSDIYDGSLLFKKAASDTLVNMPTVYQGGWLISDFKELSTEMALWSRITSGEDLNLISEFEEYFEEELNLTHWTSYVDGIDIYIWPWARNLDLGNISVDSHRRPKEYLEFVLSEISEKDLYVTFFYKIKGISSSDEPDFFFKPDSKVVLEYFESTFKINLWNNISAWFDFFFPKTFNTFTLVDWKWFTVVVTIKRLFIIFNRWFVFGLKGFDRRNIFFRFFYFFALKGRGFFFKWFCLLFKKVPYKISWDKELLYVLQLLQEDQDYYIEYYSKRLYNIRDFSTNINYFKKKYPFFSFFEFFFNQYVKQEVRKVRLVLYPDLTQTLSVLLKGNLTFFQLYTWFVLIHVYCVVIYNFIHNPDQFLFILRLYEQKYDYDSQRVFQDSAFNEAIGRKGDKPFFIELDLRHQHKYAKLRSFYFKWLRKFDAFYDKNIFFKQTGNITLGFWSFELLIRYTGYVLGVFFRGVFWLGYSASVRGSSFILDKYFFKQDYIFNQKWSNYKLIEPFRVGLKKNYKYTRSKLQIRLTFFEKYVKLHGEYRYIFTFVASFRFFYKVCVFYFLRLVYELVLFFYRLRWKRVYKKRLWRWQLKNTAKFRFAARDIEEATYQQAHHEAHIFTAWQRSLALNIEYQPKIARYLYTFISRNVSPFETKFWKELQFWAFSLVFYRRLRLKGNIVKQRWSVMQEKPYSDWTISWLLHFKFWSFFFSFGYFFVLKTFYIFLSILFFLLFVWLYNICVYIFKLSSSFFKISFMILFLSIIYPVFCLLWFLIRFIFFCIFVFYVLIRNFLIKPLLYFLITTFYNIFGILLDGWFTFLYNFYYAASLFTSLYMCVKVLLLLVFSLIIYIAYFSIKILPLMLFNRFVKGNLSRSNFFFYKEEHKQFLADFKELSFILSFFGKSAALVLGFIFFVINPIGWRLTLVKTPGESDSLVSEPRMIYILRFLDSWVTYFFSSLFSFNLSKKFVNISVLYFIGTTFVYVGCRFLEFLIFFFTFLKNYYIICWGSDTTFLHFLSNFRSKMLLLSKIWFIISFYIKNINFKLFFFKKQRKHLTVRKLTFFRIFVFFKVSFLGLALQSSIFYFLRNTFIWKTLSELWTTTFASSASLFSLRSLQELPVFIAVFYSLRDLYWALVLQISIEFGDFGWWLSYKNKFKSKLLGVHSHMIGFWNLRPSLKTFLFNTKSTTFFSKKHSLYVSLNFFTKNLHRSKPYLINNFFVAKTHIPFKNTFIFKTVSIFGSFFKHIGSFVGLSFLLEVVLLRFSQPLTLFLFGGNQNNFLDLFTFTRLNYFKDFFDEFKWLSKYTYTTFWKTSDLFFYNFIVQFRNKIHQRDVYFKKYRSSWLLSVFKIKSKSFQDLFPIFRWPFFSLAFIFFKNIIFIFLYLISFFFAFLICVILCLMFCFYIFYTLVKLVFQAFWTNKKLWLFVFFYLFYIFF